MHKVIDVEPDMDLTSMTEDELRETHNFIVEIAGKMSQLHERIHVELQRRRGKTSEVVLH